MEPISYLGYIAIILLCGLISQYLASKFNLPNILILLLVGLVLGSFQENNSQIINFSPGFIEAISLFGLILIVFDSTSRFKYKDLDAFSFKSLKIVFVFLICLFVIFMPVLFLVLRSINTSFLPSQLILFSLVFTLIMVGSDAGSVLLLFRNQKHTNAMKILELESIANTPLVVILPFLMLRFFSDGFNFTFSFIGENFLLFFKQIAGGIGTGLFIGFILFRVMKKSYSETVSHLSLLVTPLLSYVLAELIEGSGILAISALGFYFGNSIIKEKDTLMDFNSIFSSFLVIFIYILLGIYLAKSIVLSNVIIFIALYIFYLFVRFLSVCVSFYHELNFSQKLFMTFNIPKGVAVGIAVFNVMALPNGDLISTLSVVFIILSIIISTSYFKLNDFFEKRKKQFNQSKA